MKHRMLSEKDTFAYLTGELAPEHPLWKLDEESRITAIGLSCNRDGTGAFYESAKRIVEEGNTAVLELAYKQEGRMIEWLATRDKRVYLYLSQYLAQSQRTQDKVKTIFGTLHKKAALVSAFRFAVYTSLPSSKSCEGLLTDNEYAALSYLMQGDLLSDNQQTQLEDILERTANPMQDVTYFVTVAGLKLLDRYKEIFGSEMSKSDFESVSKKLCAYYSIPASSGRKKLVFEMSNFLYVPDSIQFERNASGRLSFAITPHTENEIMPYIHKDDIYFREHAPKGKGAGCPALHAKTENNEDRHSILHATTADFLTYFTEAWFDKLTINKKEHGPLCEYQ